jgi:hypothetical protein
MPEVRMRNLAMHVPVLAAAALCLAMSAGCMSFGSADSTPAALESAPAYEETRPIPHVYVELDTEDNALGAYQIAITYDPAVIKIAEITSATGDASGIIPLSDESTYLSGKTIIAGFKTSGKAASGRQHIALIRFEQVADGASPIGISVQTLSDPDGKPIPGRAALSTYQVLVGKQKPVR